MAAKTAAEKMQDLRAQLAALQDEAAGELLVTIRAKRAELATLESQYAELTGKSLSAPIAPKRASSGTRTRITIEQVKEAIKGGATNYKKIAAVLGASPANVAAKIKAEGKAAGITSEGQKAAFKLLIKK
jgi:hypothetical protein